MLYNKLLNVWYLLNAVISMATELRNCEISLKFPYIFPHSLRNCLTFSQLHQPIMQSFPVLPSTLPLTAASEPLPSNRLRPADVFHVPRASNKYVVCFILIPGLLHTYKVFLYSLYAAHCHENATPYL